MSARVIRIADSPPPGPNLMFMCPGCDIYHGIRDGAGYWTFNGDFVRPTFEPSVHVNAECANPAVPRCHSFVRDGQIQFLPDSTHKLAGHTVPLPPVD